MTAQIVIFLLVCIFSSNMFILYYLANILEYLKTKDESSASPSWSWSPSPPSKED